MNSSCIQSAELHDNNNKRIRRANYSQQEKSTLLMLVNNYKHVIENKKTDSVTNQEKDQKWQKIANEFNAISPANIFRDWHSLKKAYNNIKMHVRKEAAEERVQHFKTGGGSRNRGNPDNDSFRELALDTINNKTVFGLNNPHDSDNVMSSSILSDAYTHNNNMDEEIIYLDIQEDALVNNNDDVALDEADGGDNYDGGDNEKDNHNNYSVYNVPCSSQRKAADLNLPLDAALARKIQAAGTKKNGNETTEKWVRRRRPTAGVALHSSELSKVYHELALERLDIAKREKILVERKTEQEEEVHKLKCEILRAELRLKLQELEKK